MIKPWKIVLVLAGIFIAGSISGAFLAKQYARELWGRRAGPDQWAPNHLKRLVDNLDLPNEQAEQIRPIVRRHMLELSKLREKQVGETNVIFERMQREVSEQLTPEQRTKYEQMIKDAREKLKKQAQDRANRPPSAPKSPTGAEPVPGQP